MVRKKHDNICQRIQEQILLGQLLPGTRLSEVALAAELGVSRTPLREAFHTLVSQGILEAHESGGVFVKSVSEKDIQELYEMRLWLEPLVARKVAEVATEAQREVIRVACRKEAILCEKLKLGVVKSVDIPRLNAFRVTEVELPFHGAQCEAADNSILSQVMMQLLILKRSWMLQGIQIFSIEDAERIANEHTAIMEAILARDGDRAAAATYRHISTAYERILQLIKSKKETPDESKREFLELLGMEEAETTLAQDVQTK